MPTFTTMIDCDARAVTEQDRISSLANHPVELVDLLLGAEDELIERRQGFQLASREDAWRRAVGGSTPCLFADLCQELDTSSTPDGGAAPSKIEYARSSGPAAVTGEIAERSEIATTLSIMDTLPVTGTLFR
jgi:hypothetical protein